MKWFVTGGLVTNKTKYVPKMDNPKDLGKCTAVSTEGVLQTYEDAEGKLVYNNAGHFFNGFNILQN